MRIDSVVGLDISFYLHYCFAIAWRKPNTATPAKNICQPSFNIPASTVPSPLTNGITAFNILAKPVTANATPARYVLSPSNRPNILVLQMRRLLTPPEVAHHTGNKSNYELTKLRLIILPRDIRSAILVYQFGTISNPSH